MAYCHVFVINRGNGRLKPTLRYGLCITCLMCYYYFSGRLKPTLQYGFMHYMCIVC